MRARNLGSTLPSPVNAPSSLQASHKLTPYPLIRTRAVDFAALFPLLQPPSSINPCPASCVHATASILRASKDRSRAGAAAASMDRNLSGFLIGCVGAAVTLLAYQQTAVSSTQCVAAGFVVLLLALFVKEGFISL
ncbi:hypothetical protein ACP4OV_024442 [Aristida adscensionis]